MGHYEDTVRRKGGILLQADRTLSFAERLGGAGPPLARHPLHGLAARQPTDTGVDGPGRSN
ncbi:hypothetical protein GCM10023323_09890 [Streptomyces thinghirensis]|uniref:Uncharacterized protein n=1 Tax=Streptomyces thinghirensis TaxID=551547 RepID=A0ABP9SYU7_9ACTN